MLGALLTQLSDGSEKVRPARVLDGKSRCDFVSAQGQTQYEGRMKMVRRLARSMGGDLGAGLRPETFSESCTSA